jgi:hypothetical protein
LGEERPPKERVVTLSRACMEHLYNWRFEEAYACINEEKPTEDERYLTRALAKTFGDVGWFGGSLAEIVTVSVKKLIGEYEPE